MGWLIGSIELSTKQGENVRKNVTKSYASVLPNIKRARWDVDYSDEHPILGNLFVYLWSERGKRQSGHLVGTAYIKVTSEATFEQAQERVRHQASLLAKYYYLIPSLPEGYSISLMADNGRVTAEARKGSEFTSGGRASALLSEVPEEATQLMQNLLDRRVARDRIPSNITGE